MSDPRPLIMHVVYSFDTGGLENGVVNLINHLQAGRFRHMVVALTRCEPAFCARVRHSDVTFVDLEKPPGHGFRLYPKLYRLFRKHRPAIVHTRNLAALEAQVPAWLAGVSVRIHGEHGWDVGDMQGLNRKNRVVRRVYRPFVHRYVALSAHIAEYLQQGVGVPTDRITRICNGVDVARFCPAAGGRQALQGSPFNDPGLFIFGTVGRLTPVKDQAGLLQAFALMLEKRPELGERARLIIAGDGPLRDSLAAEVRRLGLSEHVWLAGERRDVPEVMRAMDVFVLPSLAEGISNTILEAMASGLPVVATDVGGNGELVDPEQTGTLVPSSDAQALAEAMDAFATNPQKAAAAGLAARQRAIEHFSIGRMVEQYQQLYLGNPAQPCGTEGVRCG